MADFVTVMCRLPSGVVLSLYSEETVSALATAREKNLHITPKPVASVTLKGAGHDATYSLHDNNMLGRAGSTRVDSDFWTSWLKQNSDSDLVKKQLVFAEATLVRAESHKKELADTPTGLEPIDPTKARKVGVEKMEA